MRIILRQCTRIIIIAYLICHADLQNIYQDMDNIMMAESDKSLGV